MGILMCSLDKRSNISIHIDFDVPLLNCRDSLIFSPSLSGDGTDRSLKVLAEFVERITEKGVDGIVKEYRRLDNFYDTTATYEAFRANMVKNRYSDVVCTDSTRVKLKLGEKEHGDYIHANFVNSPLLTTKFICTQGPLQSTIHDFWRMIFQERIENVLMLCKPCEDGRPKCSVYWPETVGKCDVLPTVQVKNTGEEADEFATTTSLMVELNPAYGMDYCSLQHNILASAIVISAVTDSELTPEQRKPLFLRLFRWTTWPDRGVPDHNSCRIPLQLLDRVRTAPCVVHCSAGIGRTGSILALEMALQKVVAGNKIDFEQIARELRCARAQCIQTEVQYLYIHRVMIENALLHINLDESTRTTGHKFLQEYDNKMRK
ncbi:Protein-tyrosine phosphatase [Ancylostoma caninum]|uniref:Protein-tyrosine phosphatase n=1 Tax=Ancylostoma caninum TaxID=29170 RepID=A0A368GCU5_ANCCA|nr:Protein-tyrosine phosphatase [Ancylostoma caninum]